MTSAWNEYPLHDHRKPEVWTQDTLLAHLRSLHGVDQIPDDAPLAELVRRHDELNHGTPVKTYKDDPVYQAALHPRQRLDAAGLQECHWHPSKDHPGHQALVLRTSGNTETLVCLEPPDAAMVRAALARPDEKGQLAALRNEWTARLGPGGARAVDAAHAAGYSLGVQDMQEAIRDYEEHPVTAGEVREFLLGLERAVPTTRQRADISAVLELLVTAEDRRDGRAAVPGD